MLEIYRITEEGDHLIDLHLNFHLIGKAAFITNGTANGVDEDLIDTISGYGFEVKQEYMPLSELVKRIESLFNSGYEEIVIDNIAEWVLGYDPEGEDVETIYSEASLDAIREFFLNLLRYSGDINRKLAIIVNDYFYVYLKDNYPEHVFDFISE